MNYYAFSIRRAASNDIAGMCDLLCELFSVESDFTPDREKQTRGLDLLINNTSSSSLVLVAEKDGEIIGMCSVQTLISTAEGGPVGLLEDVIVRREYRGKGIGKRLLSGVVGWCAGKDISRIQLLADADNERALMFYTDNDWAGTNLVCMRKML